MEIKFIKNCLDFSVHYKNIFSKELFKSFSKQDYKSVMNYLDKIVLEDIYFGYNLAIDLEKDNLLQNAIGVYLEEYEFIDKYKINFPLYDSLKERIVVVCKKMGDMENYKKYSSLFNIQKVKLNSTLKFTYPNISTKLFNELVTMLYTKNGGGDSEIREKIDMLKEEAIKAIYFKSYIYLQLNQKAEAFHILKELANDNFFTFDLIASLDTILGKTIYDELTLYDINLSDYQYKVSIKNYADALNLPAMKLLPMSYEREEIDCNSIPKKNLMVAMVYGQSNSINNKMDDEEIIKLKTKNVYEFYNGKCYRAENPLLGSGGIDGNSVWTLLGDRVIESGLYDNVILSAFGRGGSSVSEWKDDGKYNKVLKAFIINFKKSNFIPTHILWHQGETDAKYKMSTKKYKNNFLNMLSTIRREGITAPIYVSVATICQNKANKEIQNAQKELVNEKLNIFSGANTDTLGFCGRYDACHFSNEGKEKASQLWLEKIKFYYKK